MGRAFLCCTELTSNAPQKTLLEHRGIYRPRLKALHCFMTRPSHIGSNYRLKLVGDESGMLNFCVKKSRNRWKDFFILLRMSDAKIFVEHKAVVVEIISVDDGRFWLYLANLSAAWLMKLTTFSENKEKLGSSRYTISRVLTSGSSILALQVDRIELRA